MDPINDEPRKIGDYIQEAEAGKVPADLGLTDAEIHKIFTEIFRVRKPGNPSYPQGRGPFKEFMR